MRHALVIASLAHASNWDSACRVASLELYLTAIYLMQDHPGP
jgi:hypothetical protein